MVHPAFDRCTSIDIDTGMGLDTMSKTGEYFVSCCNSSADASEVTWN
jgi:hypothetical protein